MTNKKLFLVLALTLFFGACKKSNPVFPSSIDLENAKVLLWVKGKSTFSISINNECTLDKGLKVPCSSKIVKKWLEKIADINWMEKPPKTYPLAGKKPNRLEMLIDKEKLEAMIFNLDDQLSYVTVKMGEYNKSGYIKAQDAKLLLEDPFYFRPKELPWIDYDSITYEFDGETKNLPSGKVSGFRKILKTMKVIGYKDRYAGLKLSELTIGIPVNANVAGTFTLKGNNVTQQFRLGRPSEAKPIAYVWISGHSHIFEVEFVGWRNLRLLVNKL